MTEIKKGYKLFALTDECQLASYCPDLFVRLLYSERVWNTPSPKMGPLAVFRELLDAEKFIRDEFICFRPMPSNTALMKEHNARKYVIYEVEYEESHIPFLYFRNLRNEIIVKENLPQGTMLASKVKLNKKIADVTKAGIKWLE